MGDVRVALPSLCVVGRGEGSPGYGNVHVRTTMHLAWHSKAIPACTPQHTWCKLAWQLLSFSCRCSTFISCSRSGLTRPDSSTLMTATYLRKGQDNPAMWCSTRYINLVLRQDADCNAHTLVRLELGP